MKCAFCNKEIQGNSIVEADGLYFCNPLNRHSFKESKSITLGVSDGVQKDLPKFENRILDKNAGKSFSNIRPARKLKTETKTILGIIFGLLFAAALQQYIIPNLFTPSYDKQIMRIASEINKNCPLMVDSETRVDNALAGEGKSIIYNYTLIHLNKNEIDLNIFQSKLTPFILNTIKTHPYLKYFRDNDVTFVYNYKDKTGIYVTTLKFTPGDYK